MAHQKSAVTQAEVRRYLKAMREAGFDEGRVKIDRPDGVRVTIEAGKASEAIADASDDIDAMIEKVPHAIS